MDKLKKFGKYLLRYITVMLKKFHKKNPKLITYPSYISFVVVLIFIITANEKNIMSKNMNEIGDSLAGFAGVLAFLWIIVTALLQNRDLKLQYSEIKSMKKANESQARSLKSAEIFKVLEYVDHKIEKLTPYIEECRERINMEIESFVSNYDTGRHPNATFQPHKDIMEIWGYFRKKDVKNELLYPLDSVRDDFDYEAYLKLETIVRNMRYIHTAITAFTKNADAEVKNEVIDTITSTEQMLMIDWYREWRPLLEHLESIVKQAIVQYEIGNVMARTVIEYSLKSEADKC
ncbi:hypothetical protein [Alteromonas sp. C1M14]|uniref:hypothetical protein n=1 Tax=Alteromonas sp. C1M14 TaxID=2841567 RepID=UPI001C098085|nr:hypothetical protein [Alteromonas sp. C1M14]MBU2977500.1 hypothetical protein [Alteromonas sp. C1M14]